MKAKKFSEALGNVRDEYVSEAIAYQSKRKKRSWLKWAAMAACVCFVITGFVAVSHVRQSDNIGAALGGNAPQDIAPMVYVNNVLYKDTAKEVSKTENSEFIYLGTIESEVANDTSISNGVPNKNFQANHSITGCEVYQYGEDVVILIDEKYWLYERMGSKMGTPVPGGTIDDMPYSGNENNQETAQPAITEDAIE